MSSSSSASVSTALPSMNGSGSHSSLPNSPSPPAPQPHPQHSQSGGAQQQYHFNAVHIEDNITVSGISEVMRHVVMSSPTASSSSSTSSSTSSSSAAQSAPSNVNANGNGCSTLPPLRIWADGCFDLVHFGHSNALRQAKCFAPDRTVTLIVGVHSDAEIARHKGPPVMREHERYAHVAACKWVDEVVENAPYVTRRAVLERFNVDFCVHGEDMSYDENGRDSYWEVKEAGMYQTIKRTEGVSTTDVVSRILKRRKDAEERAHSSTPERRGSSGPIVGSRGVSQFLTSSRLLTLFSLPTPRPPPAGSSIIYVDGSFDLFHVGDILRLFRAKRRGDYLIVGVHDYDSVRRRNQRNRKEREGSASPEEDEDDYQESDLPILSLFERVLSVLSCRFVDEVVFAAPIEPTTEQLLQIGATTVLSDASHGSSSSSLSYSAAANESRFRAAAQLGILQQVLVNEPLTAAGIVERILDNLQLYEQRNKKKERGQNAIHQQQLEEYERKLQLAKKNNETIHRLTNGDDEEVVNGVVNGNGNGNGNGVASDRK